LIDTYSVIIFKIYTLIKKNKKKNREEIKEKYKYCLILFLFFNFLAYLK